MPEFKNGTRVKFHGEGTVVARQYGGAAQRIQGVEVKTITPNGGNQYIWFPADQVEEIVPTIREFLNTLTPGTVVRATKTGNKFVVTNDGRVVRIFTTTPHQRPVGAFFSINHNLFYDKPNTWEVV